MTKSLKIPRLFCFALLFGACSDVPMAATPDMGMDTAADVVVVEDMSTISQVGEVCNGPRNCVEGALCVGAKDGGFLCMAECETKYSVCDLGVCLALTPRPESICYIGGTVAVGQDCTTNLDCMSGSLCIGTADNFLCTKACDDSHACRPDQHCRLLDTGASICSKNVGEVCRSGAACADPELICTADVSSDYSDAFGLDVCTLTDCTACPTGSTCLAVPGVPDSMCVGTCESNADCLFSVGWSCRGMEACEGFADPVTCRLTLGSQRVCLPN